MVNELQILKFKLHRVEQQISKAEKRIPAHSVKPPVMEVVFALEDEKEALVKKLHQLDEKYSKG